jgi:flagellar biosynthesis protein FliQ
MNTDVALFWIQEALKTGAMLAAPILGVALAVGLVVSLFQAITSIQEMTLSYIPKMLAVGLVLLLLTPWLLQLIVDFTTNAFQFIPNVSH